MFKEDLYNFFSMQVTRIEDIMLSPNALNNEESIHIIRICLKKIKTIISFIEQLKIPGISVKHALKKENKFFNLLGCIRESYRQYDLLNEYEIKFSSSFSEYYDFIKKKVNKKRKQIEKISRFKIINHLKYVQFNILKTVDMFDDAYLFDEAIIFINNEFEKIKVLKNNLNNNKSWHSIRKHLKNNMYLISIISESHYKSEINNEIIDVIDDLQNSIGCWHDDIVSFEMFQSFMDEIKKIMPEKHNKYKKLLHLIIK